MVAMALMHRYHVSSYEPHRDPLKPLLQVYRVNAAAVAKQAKEATSCIEDLIKAWKKKK